MTDEQLPGSGAVVASDAVGSDAVGSDAVSSDAVALDAEMDYMISVQIQMLVDRQDHWRKDMPFRDKLTRWLQQDPCPRPIQEAKVQRRPSNKPANLTYLCVSTFLRTLITRTAQKLSKRAL